MATADVVAEPTRRPKDPADRPCAPSWLDALVGVIERLPGPTWLALVPIKTHRGGDQR